MRIISWSQFLDELLDLIVDRLFAAHLDLAQGRVNPMSPKPPWDMCDHLVERHQWVTVLGIDPDVETGRIVDHRIGVPLPLLS